MSADIETPRDFEAVGCRLRRPRRAAASDGSEDTLPPARARERAGGLVKDRVSSNAHTLLGEKANV